MKLKIKFLILTILMALAMPVFAEVPRVINYQGRLTDASGNAINGSKPVTFRIYDVVTGGNALWAEDHTIVAQKGVFSVLLGSVTALDIAFDKQYYIEIVVDGVELNPRMAIAASAYALNSANGTPSGGIIMWSGAINQIPEGWALCDGTNGTPDLIDRFIVGAGNEYTVGSAGGEKTHILTAAEMPTHSHQHKSPHGDAAYLGMTGVYNVEPALSAKTVEGIFDSGTAGGGQAHENRPPYYALAYIMKK